MRLWFKRIRWDSDDTVILFGAPAISFGSIILAQDEHVWAQIIAQGEAIVAMIDLIILAMTLGKRDEAAR